MLKLSLKVSAALLLVLLGQAGFAYAAGHIAEVTALAAKDLQGYLETIKLFDSKSGFFDYCGQGSLWNVFTGMVRYYSVTAGGWIKPDFMASFSMSVKDESSFAQFADGFIWFEGRQAGHFSNGTGRI